MEFVTRQELGIEIFDIPENFTVVINANEINISNENKLFQVVLTEDINNNDEDILVGLVDFLNNQIKPFSRVVSYWDITGQLNPIIEPNFPIAYRKRKTELLRII